MCQWFCTIDFMARHISTTSSWDMVTRSYAQFRNLREKGEAEEAKLKKDIMGMLEQVGEEDTAGHRTLRSERMRIGKKEIIGYKRQRRVSQVLDESLAKSWLETNGLLDKCMVTETQVFLSEDNVIGLNFSGSIPDAVFRGFYKEKETFALVLVEATEDDDDYED